MPHARPVFCRRVFLGNSVAYAAASTVLATGTPFATAIAQTEFDLARALSPRYVGAADAPVNLAEFFSMTCPHCAEFHTTTYPQLKREWIDTGRLRLEYRDYPLDGLAIYAHALARAVPPAAYANMIDILLGRQAQWARAAQPLFELQKIARFAGIGEAAFADIIDNRALQEGIVELAQEGYNRFNINSTPSFVINNRRVLAGNQSYDDLVSHLENA